MSVYLKDDKVLLDSGSVATDGACCCGVTTPCCGSPFQAFDGSCRFFNTQTYVRIGRFNESRNDPPCTVITVQAGVDRTTIDTFDELCDFSETDSASSYAHLTGFGSNCDSSTDTHCWDSFLAGLATMYLFCASCAGGNAHYTDSGVVIDDATTQHRYQDAIGPYCTEAYDHETWVLSDECFPPSGACCDFGMSECSIQTECDCDQLGFTYAGDDSVCPGACGF